MLDIEIEIEVDKTLVKQAEEFVYTINAGYSNLTEPSDPAKIVVFFPYKINYLIPGKVGLIQNVEENHVSGGTEVVFDFGVIDAGVAFGFKIYCTFADYCVDNETFTNQVEFIEGTDSKTAIAPTVTLQIDQSDMGFGLSKLGTSSARVNERVEYEIRNSNTGKLNLGDYVLEDVIPDEVDITAYKVEASTGLDLYGVHIALASNPDEYITVARYQNGSQNYSSLKHYIPDNDRIKKIKIVARSLLLENSNHSLFVYGTTNDNAKNVNSFTNKAVATSGSFTKTSFFKTLVEAEPTPDPDPNPDPNPDPDSEIEQAITNLFESVALEQTAISDILNAESKKIEKAKDLNSSVDEMIEINDSVKDMVTSVTNLEIVLHNKLNLFD